MRGWRNGPYYHGWKIVKNCCLKISLTVRVVLSSCFEAEIGTAIAYHFEVDSEMADILLCTIVAYCITIRIARYPSIRTDLLSSA